MSSGCLHENEVQALLEGGLATAQVDRVETHLDACLKCQLLVSAAARTASLRTHRLGSELPEHPCFQAGDVVSERYEITRFVARGGMGEVYAAHDRMLGDEIALKVLLRSASATSGALDRLRGEVQLARRVADPHVLRVFDLGSYQAADGGELLFLTMQLLHGETLRARIRRDGPLSPAETWRLAGDMFAALGAAHQIGIVHRDFKSDNVMLVPSGDGPPRAIVMDFGLAQAAAADAALDDDGNPLVAGTLGYMAPEQLAGGAISAAVDVYAFGVVLHEMLTGVLPPFRPVFARQGQRPPPPPPPSLLDGLDIPPRWRALIRRCLERDAGARFRNILEARDVMAGAGAGPGARGGGKPRRHVAWAAAGGAAALAAAAGILFWTQPSFWKHPSGGTPAGVAAPPQPSPAASPPADRGAGQPPRGAGGVTEPAPALPTVQRAAAARAVEATRSRRAPRPGRVQTKPEPPSRAAAEAEAPDRAGSARSIADTDEAIDPFRESR